MCSEKLLTACRRILSMCLILWFDFVGVVILQIMYLSAILSILHRLQQDTICPVASGTLYGFNPYEEEYDNRMAEQEDEEVNKKLLFEDWTAIQ